MNVKLLQAMVLLATCAIYLSLLRLMTAERGAQLNRAFFLFGLSAILLIAAAYLLLLKLACGD